MIIIISTSGKADRHCPALKDEVYNISGMGEGIFLVLTEEDGGQKCAGRIVIRK